jgi:hypothetical protein
LIKDNKTNAFSEDSRSTLWLGKRICVPNMKHLKELILREAHDSAYSIHLGSTKMYKDLKTQYWWYGMKRDIAEYVSLCDTCQRVKSKTSKASWTATTFEDSRMEMGGNRNGLHSRITPYPSWIRLNLGYSGSVNKSCSFHSSQDNLLGSQARRIVCLKYYVYMEY